MPEIQMAQQWFTKKDLEQAVLPSALWDIDTLVWGLIEQTGCQFDDYYVGVRVLLLPKEKDVEP